MIRNTLALVMAVALISWAIGCSESPTQSTDESLNLDSEFGGYTATPESPGFGDTDLLDEAASDEEYNDEILTSPEVDSIIANPEAGFYHMRIVWGRLRYDSNVTQVTDWTGSLSISRGVEVIRRVIRFEPGQDYIVRPRIDRRVIEWVSKTTVHNDGIAVDIFVPPMKPILDSMEVPVVDSLGDTSFVIVVDTIYPEPEPVTVSFETGPYSRTFELEELQKLDTIVYLDDSNAVAFHAFKLDRFPCPRGFLAGEWGYDENGKGRFRGVWWSRRPNMGGWYISGYLKGHFGKNSAGMNVFFGKWISATGEFKGFLKGTYGRRPGMNNNPDNARRGHGWFAGKIYDASRNEIGVLKGRYRAAPFLENGFFQGRWKLHCITNEPDPSDGEDGF
jgi:hypothetical protein